MIIKNHRQYLQIISQKAIFLTNINKGMWGGAQSVT